MKKTILIATFIATLIFSSLGVFAVGNYDTFDPKPVVIEGTHKVENNVSLKTGRHTFVLTAENNSPMPEGSQNGKKSVTINSNESFSFGEINFTKQGTYSYTVSRDLTKSENLKEDDAVYKCNVAVFADGSSVVVFEKVGTEGKPNSIVYTDKYIPPEKKEVKTGDTHLIFIYSSLFIIAILLLIKKKGRI